MTIIMIATLRDVKDHQKIVGYRLIETEGMTIANYPTQKVLRLLQLGHRVYNLKLINGRVCAQKHEVKIRDFPALIHLDNGSYQVVENQNQFVLVQRAVKDKLRLMRYDGQIFDFDRVSAGFAVESGKLKLPNAKILDVKTLAPNNQKFNCLTCMPYEDMFPLDETDNNYEMRLHEKLQSIQAKYNAEMKAAKAKQTAGQASQITGQTSQVARQTSQVVGQAKQNNIEPVKKQNNLEDFLNRWNIVRKSANEIILGAPKQQYRDEYLREQNINNTLVIPEGITVINDKAFENLVFGKVVCPKSLRTIQYDAFKGATIGEIVLNEGLVRIYSGAFMYVKALKKLRIPRQIVTIDSTVFQYSQLEEVILEGELKECGDRSFYSCEKLRSLYIDTPRCVYGYSCFQLNNSLVDLIIKQFGQFKVECFNGCHGLKEFIADCPGNYIDELVLNNCSNLNKVVIGNKIKKLHIGFIGLHYRNRDNGDIPNTGKKIDLYLPSTVKSFDEYGQYGKNSRQQTFYYGVYLRYAECIIHVEQYSYTHEKLIKLQQRYQSPGLEFVLYNAHTDEINSINGDGVGFVENQAKRAQLLGKDTEEIVLQRLKQRVSYFEPGETIKINKKIPKVDRQSWLKEGAEIPEILQTKLMQDMFKFPYIPSWRDEEFTRFTFATTVNYLMHTYKNDPRLLQILNNHNMQNGFKVYGPLQILKFVEFDTQRNVNEVFTVVEFKVKHRLLKNNINFVLIVDSDFRVRWIQIVPSMIDVPALSKVAKESISDIIYPGDMFDSIENGGSNRTIVQGIPMKSDKAYDIQLIVLEWLQRSQIMISDEFNENVEYMVIPLDGKVFKLTRCQDNSMIYYAYKYKNCRYKVESVGDVDIDSVNNWNSQKANEFKGTVLDPETFGLSKAYKMFNSIVQSNLKVIKDQKLPKQSVAKIQRIAMKYFSYAKNKKQFIPLLTLSDWIELLDSEIIEPIDIADAEECLDKYKVPKLEESIRVGNNSAVYMYALTKQPRFKRLQAKGNGEKQGDTYNGKTIQKNYLYVINLVDGTKLYGHQAYRISEILDILYKLTYFGVNEHQIRNLQHTDALYELAELGTFIKPMGTDQRSGVVRVNCDNLTFLGKSDIPLDRGQVRAMVFINPVNGCAYLGCQSKGDDRNVLPFLPLKDVDSGLELLKNLKTPQEANIKSVIRSLQEYMSIRYQFDVMDMTSSRFEQIVTAAALAILALQGTDDKTEYFSKSKLDSNLYSALAVKNNDVLIDRNTALDIK